VADSALPAGVAKGFEVAEAVVELVGELDAEDAPEVLEVVPLLPAEGSVGADLGRHAP
jgi:hypothetical protein